MDNSTSTSNKISKHPGSNNTTAPHVEDLLCYLPSYKVLICKDCHFAIQPSALSSHLLRHGFYRGNRKKLTKDLSQLDLAEPEDVPVPDKGDEAIGELPVAEGFICEYGSDEDGAGACGHACMAEKRMAAHWREVHDRHHVSEVRARRARLQTFFRGSKTRYFEVERGRPVADVERPVLGRRDTAERFYRNVGEANVKGEDEGAALGPELQIYDVGLMHLWHTRTGRTLGRGKGEQEEYWTLHVATLALECEWLMRCILAMTAVHSAYLGIRNGASKETIRKDHNAALRHHFAGLAGYRRALACGVTVDSAVQFAASGRLLGLSFGAGVVADQWLENHSNPESPRDVFNRSILGPLEFAILVRGSVEVQLSAQNVLAEGTPFKIPLYILKAFSYPSPISDDAELDPRLSACAKAASSLKRPTTDSEALESALASLSFCYSGGILEGEPVNENRLWMHGQCWPRLVSETYLLLLQADDPAALVVYAHWCLLIKRLEPLSWYLEGMSMRMVEAIGEILKGAGNEVYATFVRTVEETEALMGAGM